MERNRSPQKSPDGSVMDQHFRSAAKCRKPRSNPEVAIVPKGRHSTPCSADSVQSLSPASFALGRRHHKRSVATIRLPSRFGDWRGAVYYLVTILLQITGFSLVVGGGVNAGVALLRPRVEYQGAKLLGILPVEAAKDFGWLYLAALPILLVASTWEFLSPWNLWG